MWRLENLSNCLTALEDGVPCGIDWSAGFQGWGETGLGRRGPAAGVNRLEHLLSPGELIVCSGASFEDLGTQLLTVERGQYIK